MKSLFIENDGVAILSNCHILRRSHGLGTAILRRSALLAIYAGNSLVTGEFPAQRPVTRNFIFSLICTRINGWVNNRESGNLRRRCAHYDVTVMTLSFLGRRQIVVGTHCWCHTGTSVGELVTQWASVMTIFHPNTTLPHVTCQSTDCMPSSEHQFNHHVVQWKLCRCNSLLASNISITIKVCTPLQK